MSSTSNAIVIPPAEIAMEAVHAQGAGGQNVNKVSSAIHLRFDIRASSLPEVLKERLLASRDRRLTTDGVIVIKAQRQRTQEGNRRDAVARLHDWVNAAAHVPKKRRPTKPTKGSRERRLQAKVLRGKTKALRRSPVSGAD